MLLIKCIREKWISICHLVLVLLVMLMGGKKMRLGRRLEENHADFELFFSSTESAETPCQDSFRNKIKLHNGSFCTFEGTSVDSYVFEIPFFSFPPGGGGVDTIGNSVLTQDLKPRN